MRVTNKTLQTQSLNNIQKNRSEIAGLQNQAATSKRLNNPSDDPTGAARILQSKTEIKNLEQFDKNIFFARTFLESTDTSLAQLNDTLVRAKELAIQGSSDTNTGDVRHYIGQEVEQLYNTVLEISNRKIGDRFLFGGHQTQKQPFTTEGHYLGDSGQTEVQSSSGQLVPLNIHGAELFKGENMTFGYGEKKQNSTPLTVESLHQKRMNEYDSAVNESEIEETEEELHSKDLQQRGLASVDSVQRKKIETQINGVDIFTAISNLEISLKNNFKEGVQESLDSIDKALNQVQLARVEVGSRIGLINANGDAVQKNLVDQKTLNSQLEDADLFKVMSDLNDKNQTLQATLQTTAKTSNQSLMDFLR